MGLLGQRIDDGQPAHDETVLHVLGQQHRAAGFGGRSHNERIPELQFVIDDEIGRRQRGAACRIRASQCLGKLNKNRPTFFGGRAGAMQDDEQLTERLGGGG